MKLFFHIVIAVSIGLASKLCFSLPAKDFFQNPDMMTANLSPDGNKVATIRLKDTALILSLRNINTNVTTEILDSSEYAIKERAHISSIIWIDNQYIALQFSEVRNGIKNLVETQRSKRLLIVNTEDARDIRSVRTRGELIHGLPYIEGQFLYAKIGGGTSKIYTINVAKLHRDKKTLSKLDRIDGGQFIKQNELVRVEGYVFKWYLDFNGEPQAALYIGHDKELVLSYITPDMDKEIIKKWTGKDYSGFDYYPFSLTDTKNVFYSTGLEEDETTLYKVDYATGKSEKVYKTDGYKIVKVDTNSQHKLVGLMVVRDGKVSYEYYDQEKSSTTFNDSNILSLFDFSKNENAYLSYIESHDQPGAFKYTNKQTGQKLTIGYKYPNLKDSLSSKLVHSKLNVDGIDIPYLLSLPNEKSKKHPLIVMPHGGPIGIHDDAYFDETTQFFLTNNFAVLRVNFRGSSGYTKELEDAGKLEWGDGMLKDIITVTKAIMPRDDINNSRVCLVGFSYGGYASTMLTVDYPDIFKCAVNIAGVSDVNLYVEDPNNSKNVRKWLKEFVGNPTTDHKKMKAISPIYNIEKLRRPIFIGHGLKDSVVDIEHSYRLVKMLEKNNKSYELYVDEESGHNFSKLESKVVLFDKILDFIKSNIGD